MGSESSLQSVKKRSSYAKRRVRIQGPKDSFVRVRFDAASRRLLDCKAAAAHMTLSDYVRHTVQGPGGPRPRRKPPVEVVQLARTLAALGKLGGNINQMAHINVTKNLSERCLNRPICQRRLKQRT